MAKIWFLIICIVASIFISGCNSNTTNNINTKENNNAKNIDISKIVPEPTSFTTNLSFTDFDGKVSGTLPTGHWLEQYHGMIIPVGGTPPYHCTIIQSSIPGDIGFGGNSCELAGDVPEQPAGTTKGVYPFTFYVYDSQGLKAGPFGLSLTITTPPPELSIYGLDEAYTGIYYNKTICEPASNSPLNCGKDPESYNPYGGTPPYTFSASGLPLGLSMRPDGMISGTVLSEVLQKLMI